MELFQHFVILVVLYLLNFKGSYQGSWVTNDDVENDISPDDLKELLNMKNNMTIAANIDNNAPDVKVDCFGLTAKMGEFFRGLFNWTPSSSAKVNTRFYFSSRQKPASVQVYSGTNFGLKSVDFNPKRKTVMIVHGFMSHSKASWVRDMTSAFLAWGDVNVIAVDWSGGGKTWKYWRAVANTKTVGSDVTGFFQQLIKATKARVKDFHFVGHSLGAHIAGYVSHQIGRVDRVTGLDPAQPCFRTSNKTMRLDSSAADFVDIIHTNGRYQRRLGLGFPDPIGHADFYPNGGQKQPGCSENSIIPNPFSPAKWRQAKCNHGRAYLLFTESLISNNCSFRAYRWNLTYAGVNASLDAKPSAEMGIKATGAGKQLPKGRYLTITNGENPFCVADEQRYNRDKLYPLLRDLTRGDELNRLQIPEETDAYAGPMAKDVKTTTAKSSFGQILRSIG